MSFHYVEKMTLCSSWQTSGKTIESNSIEITLLNRISKRTIFEVHNSPASNIRPINSFLPILSKSMTITSKEHSRIFSQGTLNVKDSLKTGFNVHLNTGVFFFSILLSPNCSQTLTYGSETSKKCELHVTKGKEKRRPAVRKVGTFWPKFDLKNAKTLAKIGRNVFYHIPLIPSVWRNLIFHLVLAASVPCWSAWSLPLHRLQTCTFLLLNWPHIAGIVLIVWKRERIKLMTTTHPVPPWTDSRFVLLLTSCEPLGKCCYVHTSLYVIERSFLNSFPTAWLVCDILLSWNFCSILSHFSTTVNKYFINYPPFLVS